jgi:hypothetical protein
VIELWEKGVLTEGEFCIWVLQGLTEENVAEFIEKCPADLRLRLSEWVMRLPADSADDEAWRWPMYGFAGIIDRSLSEEELAAISNEEKRRFRQGVKLFRASK